MFVDPIIEEVRQARDAYARQFEYDLEAMAEDLRKREQEHPERLVSLQPKTPRRAQSAS